MNLVIYYHIFLYCLIHYNDSNLVIIMHLFLNKLQELKVVANRMFSVGLKI